MSLEVVVGLSFIAFIYAYIYGKTPKENFWFRLFFLSACLFTVSFLCWVLYNTSEITIVKKYDANENFVGTEILNTTLSDSIKSGLLTYMEITIWIPIIVLAVSMVIFIWNIFSGILEKKKQKRGY